MSIVNRNKLEHNIEKYLKGIWRRTEEVDSSGPPESPVATSCEQTTKLSCFIKGGKIIDYLSDANFIRMNFWMVFASTNKLE
jgi:hypothetical protein